jgi:ABC-type branched-subunit amino acid transport system substrate-binding protein
MAATFLASQATGATIDAFFPVGALDDQSTFAPYIQRIVAEDANFFYPNNDDRTMIKFHNEALAQRFDLASITRYCSLACYSALFRDAGDAVAGVYVGLNFLPFEEADVNETVAAYVDSVEEPSGLGADSYAAALLFQRVIEEIVGAEGPNALTRARLLEQLASVEEFDAGGMFGTIDIGNRIPSPCFVVLQFDGAEFVRVHPAERGTLDCTSEPVPPLIGFDAIAYADENAG